MQREQENGGKGRRHLSNNEMYYMWLRTKQIVLNVLREMGLIALHNFCVLCSLDYFK